MNSAEPVTRLSGVGTKKAALYEKLGIFSLGDLLSHYPRRYINCTAPILTTEVAEGEPSMVRARVAIKSGGARLRGGGTIYKVVAYDDAGGQLNITIFNNRYAFEGLKQGETYLFFGKGSPLLGGCEMANPQIFPKTTKGLLPVYPLTAGLTEKQLRKDVLNALKLAEIADPLPSNMLEEYGLIPKPEAIQKIHTPKSQEEVNAARKRLAFEELFCFSAAVRAKSAQERKNTGVFVKTPDMSPFLTNLGFTLTKGQADAVNDCLSDMASGRQMHRLIQGDVGCGKTAVAAAISYAAAKNGFQTACMAPTELLARQHYDTLSKMLSPLSIKVTLLTGGMSAAEKKAAQASIATGETDVAVGTHALISDATTFSNLGLVVTDEQHRFGVAQREALANKGDSPHLAVMSATPIPRTLALFCYGDLQISRITTLPAGRIPIQTFCIGSDKRERAFGFVKKEIAAGNAAYIVCPRIEEENEDSELSALLTYAQRLTSTSFRGVSTGILHGKLKPAEKDAVMSAFLNGEIDLLISTTVVEVGVDVPRATVMLIENAERYGLSQLHQLRGRVGRGENLSYCSLVSDHRRGESGRRVMLRCENTDGFALAEADLQLRGPGDLFGTAQHGLPRFSTAEFITTDLLNTAGEAVGKLFEADPTLSQTKHALLRKEIEKMYRAVGQG